MQKRTYTSIGPLGETSIFLMNEILLNAAINYKTYSDEIVKAIAEYANALSNSIRNLNEQNYNKLKNIVKSGLEEFTIGINPITPLELRNDLFLLYKEHINIFNEVFTKKSIWNLLMDFYEVCIKELEINRQEELYER